jgi:hypothetical protein
MMPVAAVVILAADHDKGHTFCQLLQLQQHRRQVTLSSLRLQLYPPHALLLQALLHLSECAADLLVPGGHSSIRPSHEQGDTCT